MPDNLINLFALLDLQGIKEKCTLGSNPACSTTVYIGDGAFGRESRNVDRTLRWYNSMEKSVVHFWQVDVTHEAVKLQAIDRKRQVFDTLLLP